MPFEKGNVLETKRRAYGGGRKAKLSTQIKRALASVPVAEIFATLQDLAAKGDREACIYLLDRILGKPTQKSELDLQGDLTLTNPNIREVWLKLVELEKLPGGSVGLLNAGDAPEKDNTQEKITHKTTPSY